MGIELNILSTETENQMNSAATTSPPPIRNTLATVDMPVRSLRVASVYGSDISHSSVNGPFDGVWYNTYAGGRRQFRVRSRALKRPSGVGCAKVGVRML